ncbi:MAG: GxGYxYP family putative glycoside hydrolase, partial [Terrisporobacter sp.]
MKKLLKIFLSIILTLLFSFNIFALSPKAFSDVNIVEDSANTFTLPHRFRKSTDSVPKTDSNENLNLYGLSTLNISGSAQFSDNGLSLIKDSIGENIPINVVDLREESHGFVNGIAISFENTNNNANAGLTRDDVIAKESKDLSSIKINEPLTFSNKNITIYPKVVQSELVLTSTKELSYVRIPVTDGGLPSDDMVNYFVNYVNAQKKDTWLHFHCKAGIGRTTTFMIMYDIIKNCNEVALNDIITRQVLLSKMDDSNAKDFYSGNRFNFLNSFYTKCKNNEYKAQTSSISSETNTTDSYIKNSIIPKLLYVICESDMTCEEQTMIATLQGVVSTKSKKQIYILSNNEPDYEIWLKDLKDNYNVKCKYIKSPWKLLKIFEPYVNGYILYNNSNKYSINNACSLASLKGSIVINELLESKVKLNGIKNLILDCRDTDKYWAYNTLWNLGLNHSTVIQLPPNKSMALRDYGIMSKSLFF